MENLFLIIITLLVICVSASMYKEGFSNAVTYVTADHDHRSYLVRNLPDKDQAANLLSVIRGRLIKLVKYLKNKYPKERRVQRMASNFNSDQISESTPDSQYTSYSVNKGEKIVFCIRQRDEKNELVDLNTMMFVAIHEMAHLMTLSIGHTKEFWDNMQFILNEAMNKDLDLYSYQPFHESPVPYCGTMISDTPLKLENKTEIPQVSELIIEEQTNKSKSH